MKHDVFNEQGTHYLEAEFAALMSDPETFRFLDTGAVDGFWYLDLEDPENEWMSPGFWRALGFDPALRKHSPSEWQDLIFPEDGDIALESLQQHCADPDFPYDNLVRYKTADGGTITIRCRGKAVRENGVPKRMLGSHTIVHDTRAHELDREMSELLKLSGDAILAWSAEQGIQRWNRGAALLYGVEEALALGQNPNTLTQAEFEEPWSDIERRLLTGRDWSGDVVRKHKDGTRCVTSTRLQRVEISGGHTLFLQIDRDATQHYDAQQRQKLLTRELHHRVKNLFAVIQGLVNMSARYETDAKVLGKKISSRISSLASAHLLGMDAQDERQHSLHEILEVVLAPYKRDADGLVIDGPDVEIPRRAVNPLGMILHELATNAVKYGAWAHDGGSITVGWDIHENNGVETLNLTWVENAPGANIPNGADLKNGFGTKLISISATQLDGTITQDWTKTGLKLDLGFAVGDTASGARA